MLSNYFFKFFKYTLFHHSKPLTHYFPICFLTLFDGFRHACVLASN
ncbi:hypothetical protein SBA4_1270006 [Candidatus Sulfopaludibacter sp. SbA4]|nr:hypothetical protein SBA4_1270006 [Candidatus Sulfopaludibacter sp. SbA4]